MPKLLLLLSLLSSQVIKAQCPYFVNCPANTIVCDTTNNDPFYWKAAPKTWNPDLKLSDLPEQEVALNIKAIDSCGGQNISVDYTLFLDLDGDDSLETVIYSPLLPPSGKVLYNNILSPNYTQGDTIDFDHRVGVTDTLKHRFALELIQVADTTFASLKWSTGKEDLQYSWPKLPLGKHRIVWRISQAGVEQFCGYDFEVRDCGAPEIKCWPSLAVNMFQNGIQIWASDLLFSIDDNITPSNLLLIGERKLIEQGVGFPTDANGKPITSVTFHCDETWVHPVHHTVELWVKDKAGNVDSCWTDVSVVDGNSVCNFDPTILITCSETVANDGIENVEFKVEGDAAFTPAFSLSELSKNNGCAIFEGYVPCSASFTIVPSRNDNPNNGVTTYDLVLISKHILGIEPLNAPHKIIAADVNKSGSITTFDIVELRKLILGIYDKLPIDESWRFWQKSFSFPNPQNPFQTALPDTMTFTDWNCSYTMANFTGVKIGDVNGTAIPNAIASAPTENRALNFLSVPDLYFKKGETREIALKSTEIVDWLGLQLGMDYNSELIEIETVVSPALPDFNLNNWAKPTDGQLTLSWSTGSSMHLTPKESLLNFKIKAKADVRLSEVLKPATDPKIRPEVYDSEGESHPLRFAFSEKNAADGNLIFVPQPNPTAAGASIPIQLATAVQVQISIADFSGKLLWINDLNLENGAHVLDIPAMALPESGVYFWQIKFGDQLGTGKIIRI